MITPDDAIAIFERALEAEIGIAIQTPDPKTYRQELLLARRKLKDPRYDILVTALPAGNKEVFVCKKNADLEP